jgi:hypothetical protein
MESAMKLTFRLYRRGRRYYVQNNDTGQQESLETSDKQLATRLLHAKNEAANGWAAIMNRFGDVDAGIAPTQLIHKR